MREVHNEKPRGLAGLVGLSRLLPASICRSQARLTSRCLRNSKERKQHFALFADKTQKMLSLTSSLFFKIDIPHDDRADGNALDLCVRLGDYNCVHI